MYPARARLLVLCALLLAVAAVPRENRRPRAPEQPDDRLRVGLQPGGRIVVPTNQVLTPAGRQITFPGRPVDLAFADDGRTVVVKDSRHLLFLDADTGHIRQTLQAPTGLSVVGLLVDGDYVYVTDAHSRIHRAERRADGRYRWSGSIELKPPAVKGVPHPAGIARLPDGNLLVTSTRGNNVQVIAPDAEEPAYVVPVGVAPYTACCPRPDRCYVSNWGGDPPAPGAPQANSSGTPVHIDPQTGVADRGSVTVLGLAGGRWHPLKSVAVGLHPSGLAASRGGRFVYVANANSDTVSVIRTGTDEVVETIACRPEARLPFGSGTNALALSPDGGTLYAANGTNNCVAVIRLGRSSSEGGAGRPEQSRLAGLIPTGWYPGAILVAPDGRRLFVANIKGLGSLGRPRPAARGRNSRDYLGSVSVIRVPGDRALAAYTATVNANNRLAYSLAGLDGPRPNVPPVPVPERHGEPSVFKHVIYVIKENRTYDQVFGDLREGNGDPHLVMYGEDVTPNHHALARQFTLFDNFYCSGVLSADGHCWVTAAYATDYLERSFGGFTRSYPDDGRDALAYAPTGFLWDNALRHGRTFRNFGEFVTNTFTPRHATWSDLYADYRAGTRRVQVRVTPTMARLEPYTHPGYPWFPLIMPDVYRARLFLDELKSYEEKGEMPSLIYLTLPCDHTSGLSPGQPTPQASVADNDLALGQIVEGVSRSRFWEDTCIFVVEDDPQNGFDHVDGHRTVALVISPYTRRHFVDHTCYNQTGMIKTIELLLGLPPMNQLDLSATPMRACFRSRPDLTPYACTANQVALDHLTPPLRALRGEDLRWAEKSLTLDFDEGDKADADTLNRILWYAARGPAAYPAEFVGSPLGDDDEVEDD